MSFTLRDTKSVIEGRTVYASRDDETAEISVMKMPFDDELTDEEIQAFIDGFAEDHSELIEEFLGSRYSTETFEPESEELVRFQSIWEGDR
jgi:TolB-like protein